MIRRLALLLIALPLVAACSGGDDDDDDVPANPTWNDDVQAILTTRCATCHADTPLSSAPDGFRLDVYDDDGDDLGAFSFRCDVKNRAVDGLPSFMPPAGALPSVERATIERWIEQGGIELAGGAAGPPCP